MSAFRTMAVFFDALATYRSSRKWGLSRREESAALVDAWRELPAAVAPPLATPVWRALQALRSAERHAPGVAEYQITSAIEEMTRSVADAIDDACEAAVEEPEVSHEAVTIPPPPPVPRDTVPSESGVEA